MIIHDDTLLDFLRPAQPWLRRPVAEADVTRLTFQTRVRLARVCVDMPRELFEQLVTDVVRFKVKWCDDLGFRSQPMPPARVPGSAR